MGSIRAFMCYMEFRKNESAPLWDDKVLGMLFQSLNHLQASVHESDIDIVYRLSGLLMHQIEYADRNAYKVIPFLGKLRNIGKTRGAEGYARVLACLVCEMKPYLSLTRGSAALGDDRVE